MLVTLAARCVSDGNQLVRVVVAMGLAFHALAGWLLYRCLQRFVSRQNRGAGGGLLDVRLSAAGDCQLCFGNQPVLCCLFAELLGLSGPHRTVVATGGGERQKPHSHEEPRFVRRSLGLVCLWARTEAIVLLACAVGWLGVAALFIWPTATASAGEGCSPQKDDGRIASICLFPH